jgi:hypothetical protein
VGKPRKKKEAQKKIGTKTKHLGAKKNFWGQKIFFCFMLTFLSFVRGSINETVGQK